MHVYSDLPCTSAIGAMSYHPSEHMLVLSSFGNCQAFVVLNYLLQSLPVTQKGGGVFLSLAKGPTGPGAGGGGAEGGEGWGTVTEAVGALEARLKDSRRLSNLAKSLEKVTARTKS